MLTKPATFFCGAFQPFMTCSQGWHIQAIKAFTCVTLATAAEMRMTETIDINDTTILGQEAVAARPQENGGEVSNETIEERCFSAALVCLEGHFTQSPPMGPQTTARVSSMISKTLEKTHTLRKAR